MVPSGRDDLFTLDPAEFVAARDALAKALRAEGDKEAAAAIKQLRRPAVPIWALNRVARDEPAIVQELLALAEDARAAQDAVLAGADRDELRTAAAARQRAINEVAERALVVIADSGRTRETYDREIHDGLHAVVASAGLSRVFAHGELLSFETDDDVFAGAELPANPPARTRRPSNELTSAREQVARAEEAVAATTAELRAAEDAYDRAQREAEAARKVVADAKDALKRTREEVQRLEQ